MAIRETTTLTGLGPDGAGPAGAAGASARPSGGRGGAGRVADLEVIEFTGASSVAEYARVMRGLGRDLAQELLASADELEAVLSRQKGHPLLAGVDTRWRARRVANRLRRAGECAVGLAVESVRFNAEFRTQFADVLQPTRRAAPRFDWNA